MFFLFSNVHFLTTASLPTSSQENAPQTPLHSVFRYSLDKGVKQNHYVKGSRIWFLRHCDKPIKKSDPCCSETGYKRAVGWAHYLGPFVRERRVEIYASGSTESASTCLDGSRYGEKRSEAEFEKHFLETQSEENGYEVNPTCQKSQRMWLTAHSIQTVLNGTMNPPSYCIGDGSKVIQEILRKRGDGTTDFVVVWEHEEIIEMIRSLGVSIKDWKKKELYDLVFMMDLDTRTLYYQCVPMPKEGRHCLKATKQWLGRSFHTIPNEESNKSLLWMHGIKQTYKAVDIRIKVLVAFLYVSLFLFLCMMVGCSRGGRTTTVNDYRPIPVVDSYHEGSVV